MSSNAMAIQLDDVSFSYDGKVKTLEACSLAIEARGHTGLIGPNGSGKTTLFKLLIRVLKPSAGRISILGRKIGEYTQRELARAIAYVPQDSELLFPLSGFEMVMMGRSPYLSRFARETALDAEIVEKAMRFTETLCFANRPVTELSGGERERLLLARAIAQETPILLLDEPYTHLDLRYQWKMRDWLAELSSQKAIFSILHSVEHAENCESIILFGDGHPFKIGSPKEMLARETLLELFS